MRNRIPLPIIGIVFSIVLVTGDLRGQNMWTRNPGHSGDMNGQNQQWLIKTIAMPTSAKDSVRVYVYYKISNDMLQFIDRDSVYTARFEVTAAIQTRDEQTIAGTIQKKSATARNYAQTNDRTIYQAGVMRFLLPVGRFSLFLELTDAETDQPVRYREDIETPDFFSGGLTLSDLLFYRQSTGEMKPEHERFPEFPAVFTVSDSLFWARFYICSDPPHPPVLTRYRIIDNQNDTVFTDSTKLDVNAVIYPVRIIMSRRLSFGRYTLHVDVQDHEGRVASAESPFYVRNEDQKVLVTDRQFMIQPLQYIMPSDLWNRVKKAPEQEQLNLITRFWAERDPDPTTPENELEEEFYRRVHTANRNFSEWADTQNGWNTDRGRIYIIYGAPSDVEKLPGSSGGMSVYEIWYYRNLQKRFVFLDRLGSGDFRLISEE